MPERIDVLFVEDDDALRTASCERLREEGFRVMEAADGVRALECLERGHRPALLILDLLMPEMDGFQLMARLRSRADLSEIPVLIVSAVVRSGAVAGPHGIFHQLSKPFQIEELIAYARRVSRKSKN